MIKCLHIPQFFSKEYKPFISIALFVLIFVAVGNRYTFSQGFAQKNIPSAEFIEQNKDSLRLVLLVNKQIVEDYEASILTALMYYPDLKATNIQFRNSRITTSMAAIPRVGNVFRKRENRKYSILINNKVNSNRAPLISDVSFTAKVGIIGHELAHIVDYKTKSNMRLIYEGLSYYFNTSFKIKLEHKIDRIAIHRGLGDGIMAFRIFIDEESDATEKYKKFKSRVYLSSTDIGKIINEFNGIPVTPNILDVTSLVE